ncbi:Histone deacetylase 8 [Perkinsus chesapeaki]|uniref:histone deacetylase n=1 Tax=Perkinsus chesapeaki TaxID=330153 RepID=A0A7J6M9I9_PERCH|nr:Histone deacetylase 8 [Perkinsus chesapeaki]
MAPRDSATAEAGKLPATTSSRFDTPRPVAYFTDIHHRILGNGRYEVVEGTDIGAFKFAVGGCGDHPMDPERLRLTHSLILNYGLLESESPMNRLSLYSFEPATFDELAVFHDRRYLDFIRNPSETERKRHVVDPFVKYNLSLLPWTDCTLFEGVYDYCCRTAGASLDAAQWLCDNTESRPVAINWNGGMHHAHCANAAGFCYVNDIVLAIVKLLEVYDRVLYVDLDYHHGDAVEEAFYSCPRVVTLSIHSAPSKSSGNSFPGTGAVYDIGPDGTPGKGHAVNLPMKPGLTDDLFLYALRTTLEALLQRFRPSCLVVQSGSDSLAGDLLTSHSGFNLSTRGHATAVQELRRLGIPTLVLGGGGYSLTSVAKCWSMETAVWLNRGEPFLSPGAEDTSIPSSDQYYVRYDACPSVHVKAQSNLKEHNTRDSVEHTVNTVLDNINKYIPIAPSVPFGLSLPEAPEPKRRRSNASLDEADAKGTFINHTVGGLSGSSTMAPCRPRWNLFILTAAVVEAIATEVCEGHGSCLECTSSPLCWWCPARSSCEAWPEPDGFGKTAMKLAEGRREQDACEDCVGGEGTCYGSCYARRLGPDDCALWFHGEGLQPPPDGCLDFYRDGLKSLHTSLAMPLFRGLRGDDHGNMTDEIPMELELSGWALALVLVLPIGIPLITVAILYYIMKCYRRCRRQGENPNENRSNPTYVNRTEANRLISQGTRRTVIPEEKCGSSETCNVCIDSIHAGDSQRTLWCGHAFHDECIRTWLLRPQRIRWPSTDEVELQTRWYDPKRMSCPTCRTSIVDALGPSEIFPTIIGHPAASRSSQSIITY